MVKKTSRSKNQNLNKYKKQKKQKGGDANLSEKTNESEIDNTNKASSNDQDATSETEPDVKTKGTITPSTAPTTPPVTASPQTLSQSSTKTADEPEQKSFFCKIPFIGSLIPGCGSSSKSKENTPDTSATPVTKGGKRSRKNKKLYRKRKTNKK